MVVLDLNIKLDGILDRNYLS